MESSGHIINWRRRNKLKLKQFEVERNDTKTYYWLNRMTKTIETLRKL